MVATKRYTQLFRKTVGASDPLGTVKIRCGHLEIQASQDEGQWVASVEGRPELIAQSRTLEGVLRQVLEYESIFCAGTSP